MKLNFIITGSLICMVLLITSGCTTSCIPVTPTQIIPTTSGRCVAVIDNTSYDVTHSSDCSKIKPNEINRVFFYGTGWIGPATTVYIEGVCQP